MPFEKGKSGNPDGKPKGAKNRITLLLREMINEFLEENFQIITQDFKKLPPRDRTKLYCDLLQFGLPKLQSVSSDIPFDKLSNEQIDQIIEQLRKYAVMNE